MEPVASSGTPQPLFASGRAPISRRGRKPRVAIIHYWLVGMRGGEKVIEQLCELFPDADIFTHIHTPSKISDTINAHTIKTTSIQSIPFAPKIYKKLVSLMPAALEKLDLSAYDLVISSESGPAKGVIARPDALHICYVHSPMRYIWDQYNEYRNRAGFVTRMVMPGLIHTLRQWDVSSAARVDHFIANSRAVGYRIEKYWRRESEVIPPPVDTQRFDSGQVRENFYLFCSELVSYKRADIAIRACKALDRRLIVIGDGPELNSLKEIAGPNTEFLGRVPDRVLEDHVQKCRAFLFPAEEDFGIAPVEAMAAGAPVIAFGRGGARDYVVPGMSGLFMRDQSMAAMIESIVEFELSAERYESAKIASHARTFDKQLFKSRISTSVLEQIDLRPHLGWMGMELRRQWRSLERENLAAS